MAIIIRQLWISKMNWPKVQQTHDVLGLGRAKKIQFDPAIVEKEIRPQAR